MNAKKLLALSLACTLTLGLSACGGGQDAPSSGSPSGASDGDALKVGIILSTMFLKQHSIIDAAAGIALTLILYVITYHTGWRKLFQRTPLRFLVS